MQGPGCSFQDGPMGGVGGGGCSPSGARMMTNAVCKMKYAWRGGKRGVAYKDGSESTLLAELWKSDASAEYLN